MPARQLQGARGMKTIMVALLSSLVVSACAVDDPSLGSRAQDLSSGLAIVPSGWDFGSVTVGQPSFATLTAENLGATPTSPLAVTLEGTGAASFGLARDTCSDVALAPGATCTFQVTFKPTALGASSASVTLHAADGAATAKLGGIGVGESALVLSARSWDFGSIPAFTHTASVHMLVSNQGVLPSGPITITVSGTDFELVSNGCAGVALAAYASCGLDLRFSPLTRGFHESALTATAQPGGTTSATVWGIGSTPLRPLPIGPVLNTLAP
jgi:hypothetical protein